MSKEIKIIKQHNLTSLHLLKNNFVINDDQELKFTHFLNHLSNYNKHTNLVGMSTLLDPWRSHILDCIQIVPFIKNKNSTILDLGTGPGLPGLVFTIMGYANVTLIDSNNKKIQFIRNVCSDLEIKANICLERIENFKAKKYDFLVSRALATLSKLFTYSHNFIKDDTVLIFLKGKTVNDEIKDARKTWAFYSELHQSYSDKRGKVLIIKKLSLNK